MQYSNGTDIRVGDRVRLINGEAGTVVFSVDNDEYSSEYPKADWEYLKEGIMIKTDKGALVHLAASNQSDMQLL